MEPLRLSLVVTAEVAITLLGARLSLQAPPYGLGLRRRPVTGTRAMPASLS
jgi:hypothetical protein